MSVRRRFARARPGPSGLPRRTRMRRGDVVTKIDGGGRVLGDPVKDIKDGLKKAIKFWRHKMREALDPASYENPEAVIGGGRWGAIKKDPGYRKHLDVEVKRDGKGYDVISRRPFLPDLSMEFLQLQDEEFLAWLDTQEKS